MLKVENVLGELKNTTRPAEKIDILLKYDSPFFRRLLRYTFEPFVLFHVKLQKKDIPTPGTNSLTDLSDEVEALLKFCMTSNSNKENRTKAQDLLGRLNTESQALLIGVLNKNWKVGISNKTVLKAYPNLFPIFEVQLANKFEDYRKKRGFNSEARWLCTPKLDGVRCIALYVDGAWRFYSRQGKEFLTVLHLIEALETYRRDYGLTFFDGELYRHGLPFEEIQGAVMSYTKGVAEDVEYHVFIVGSSTGFLQQDSSDFYVPYMRGLEDSGAVKIVPVETVCSREAETYLDKAFEDGYEGVMLRRPNKLYDFKRSDALLKLKKSASCLSAETVSDCLVRDIVIDEFPVVYEDATGNNIIKHEMLLTKLIVEQKDGILCTIGSGFSLDFRRTHTANNGENLIGKVVEIAHQGVGTNGRMRFPRLHRIREDIDF